MVGKIGRKLLSGSFNLTTVSFPIVAQDWKSNLFTMATVPAADAYFFSCAAATDDVVERMKFIVAASVAYIQPTHHWKKPLNPIIGETYQATSLDGSRIYIEQVSHHPPISYCLSEGPNGAYRWFGYSSIAAHAYFNSVTITVTGWKQINFKDGSSIKYTNAGDVF